MVWREYRTGFLAIFSGITLFDLIDPPYDVVNPLPLFVKVVDQNNVQFPLVLRAGGS